MGYKFVKTNDGSTGLYDEDVNDIYHSSLGAYKEAIEKFVIPSQLERFKNKTCRVLDICYGIGYNTKVLLKYCAKNNLNIKFKIDAVEINEELISISPFIKNHKPDYCDFEIDGFILNSYLRDFSLDFDNIKAIIKENKNFLTLYKPNFDGIIKKSGYKYNPEEKFKAFLHNIYYHNMSHKHKNTQNLHFLKESALKWDVSDARKAVLSKETDYDIIFLDAFTASKQPILWSYQFLKELALRLDKDNGILLSYSSASPFRKSLKDLNLYVGKYYEKNINTTLASYNKNLIKYMLDEFELGLLETKAGIYYEDEKLNMSCEEILKRREEKQKNSELETTSSYYKRYNRRYGKH